MSRWKNLWQDESGQGLAEYSLILSVVVVAAVVILSTLSDTILQLLAKAHDTVTDAISR
ncbi:MAG TPA: Flp family type IVb pilin [Firmicutes bacterium]|nr:Flp family type IVb pilin [Bacillota bacterium]